MYRSLALILVALTLPGIALADEPVISLADDYVVLDAPTGQLRFLAPLRGAPGVPQFVPADESPWQVVYLNFDGAKLEAGGNDAKTNRTDLILTPTLDYPAMSWTNLGGKQQGMKDVVDQLKLIFLKFAVKLVTERPTEGDYTMAMIGGTGESCKKGSAGTVGIAPLDCTNTNKSDITLIFGGLMSSSAKKLAFVIAHELGHTFGLEHVTDTKGIMYPALNPEVCCWVTSSLSEASTCGRPTQDEEKILADNVGVGKQDTLPPLVWFKRPGAGAILPPDVSFEVTAADDLGVHHVVIFLDGKQVLELSDPPYTDALTNLGDGEHTLMAEVHDWAEQKNTAELKFTVSSSCVLDGTCNVGKGGTDSECETGDDCASGMCARQKESDPGRCVETCDGSVDAICPKGTRCLAAGESHACLTDNAGTTGTWTLDLAGTGGGGGCSVGSWRPAGLPVTLLLLALVLVSRRRRR